MNVGGKAQYVYDFIRKDNPKIKKEYLKKKSKLGMPFNSSMNLSKLNLFLKKWKY